MKAAELFGGGSRIRTSDQGVMSAVTRKGFSHFKRKSGKTAPRIYSTLALALLNFSSCAPALAQEPSEPHALIVALYEYDRGELLHYRKWKHGLTEEQCEQAKFDMMGQWLKSRDIRMVDEGLLRDYQMEQFYRFKCWPEAGVGGQDFKAWVGKRVEVR